MGILASFLGISTASAEPTDSTSWVFVGGGLSSFRDSDVTVDQESLLIDAGIGSSGRRRFVFGAGYRFQTHFDQGTDMMLVARTATQGYALGDWGAAVDLGGYWRLWDDNDPLGYTGSLSLGAPWGMTAQLGFTFAPDETPGYSAVLGIDFARLTVYRRSGLSWFSNIYPSPGHDGPSPYQR
ncbi:MAG: hypothetical protein HRU17_06115 [Polyangiaceae bacterium]|nr:hypothetical protein [Polyangiaceae bacterium]